MRKAQVVLSIFALLYVTAIDTDSIYEKIEDFLSEIHSEERDIDPDAHRSFEEIVHAHNYPLETHYVQTSDGYILKIFRIFGKKGATEKIKGLPAILICHGLGDSSDSAVVNDENMSIAYIAAEAGMDVWFMNNRGNKHSLKHVSLDTNNKRFWDFSYHEMGLYDVPAVVDYIKKITGLIKVTLQGHSQGGAQIFVLCSTLPIYCRDNITGIIALAPAVFVTNMSSSFVKLATTLRLDVALPLLGYHHLFGSREDMNNMTHTLCLFNHAFCDGIQGLISNDHPEENNEARDDVMKSHYPSGMSTLSLRQFAYSLRNDDFGWYKTKKSYNLKGILTPVILFGGNHDGLVVPEDINRLAKILKSIGMLHKFYQLEHHAHITFLLSKGQDEYREKLSDAYECFKN